MRTLRTERKEQGMFENFDKAKATTWAEAGSCDYPIHPAIPPCSQGLMLYQSPFKALDLYGHGLWVCMDPSLFGKGCSMDTHWD
jgi:hypothetical protein